MATMQDDGGTPTERRLERLVDADDAARKAAVVTKSRQALIRELDKKTPDIAVVRENIAVVLEHEGYDGVFKKDPLLDTSIGDQLTKRKGDPLAKQALDYITAELLAKTRSENATSRANTDRARQMFSGPDEGRS